jgi:hypothetical protein
MLVVAEEYSTVIDAITADKDLKLRKYELKRPEWRMIRDLIKALKASSHQHHISLILN